MTWPDTRIEQLKALWEEGFPASQISRKMGGISTNAIYGKVHRLGLSGQSKPPRPQPVSTISTPTKKEKIMFWDEEKVEQLKALWEEGLSANQIAIEMRGVSRNAVMGKVHRLGLSGRDTPTKPREIISPEQKRPTPVTKVVSKVWPTTCETGEDKDGLAVFKMAVELL